MTLIVTIFLCLVVFEVILHFTMTTSCKQSDLLLDHSNIPGCHSRFKTFEWDVSVDINSDGLRDDEILPKEYFDQRILVLGDSFTWGYGVEKKETFVDVLDVTLGSKIDVINAGVTSYSPSLEYLYLKNNGLKLKPDVVILAFDQSDFQDDYVREKSGVFDENGQLVAVPKIEDKTFWMNVRKQIRITNFIADLLRLLDSQINHETVADQQNFIGDVSKDRYAVTRFESLDSEEEYWLRTFSYIQKINELTIKENISFVLVTYPYAHQVSKDEWANGRHLFGFNKDEIYSSRANEKLAKFAKEEEILFISAFDEFKQSSTFPLYFSYDGHLNRNGHFLLADVIANGLFSFDKKVINESGKFLNKKLPHNLPDLTTNQFTEISG